MEKCCGVSVGIADIHHLVKMAPRRRLKRATTATDSTEPTPRREPRASKAIKTPRPSNERPPLRGRGRPRAQQQQSPVAAEQQQNPEATDAWQNPTHLDDDLSDPPPLPANHDQRRTTNNGTMTPTFPSEAVGTFAPSSVANESSQGKDDTSDAEEAAVTPENALVLLSNTLIKTMGEIRDNAVNQSSYSGNSRSLEISDLVKKLPEFSGKPIEWSHFKQTYL